MSAIEGRKGHNAAYRWLQSMFNSCTDCVIAPRDCGEGCPSLDGTVIRANDVLAISCMHLTLVGLPDCNLFDVVEVSHASLPPYTFSPAHPLLIRIMIHSVLIINQAGKPRLSKWYSPYPPQDRLAMVQRIFDLVRERSDSLCNFVEIPLHEIDGSKGKQRALEDGGEQQEEVLRIVYRHYATLYFVFCVDEAESELGILDLIQVFVESLDRCFENVCELDLIFQFDAVHCLLNCMVVGGYVQETSIDSIAALFNSQMKSRKASVQAGSISNSLPDISIGSMGGAGSWSEKLTRNLGRGRLGR